MLPVSGRNHLDLMWSWVLDAPALAGVLHLMFSEVLSNHNHSVKRTSLPQFLVVLLDSFIAVIYNQRQRKETLPFPFPTKILTT